MTTPDAIEHWSGEAGDHWASEADRYDRMNRHVADQIIAGSDGSESLTERANGNET